MDNKLSDRKKHAFREELNQLLKADYISLDTYDRIIDAHYQYHKAIQDEKHTEKLSEKSNKQQLDAHSEKELSDKSAQHQKSDPESSQVKNNSEKTIVTSEQQATKTLAQKQVKPPKKKLTDQEIRERNITWLLGIGVVFLLIAGTFLATSTWYLLPNVVKTLFIVLVAGLFFGLALLTDKVLKISKTGFAFYVLGSLFLPIIILSVGFYGQLGYYLSVDGEGRYLLGALGSGILMPTYMVMAKRLDSRLFIWFAYVALSSTGSFLLGWLNFPIDGFYLGMVLFNTGLIFFYRYARTKYKETLLIKDFIKYVQANLVLTSAFVILFYDNAMMNGFNVIITAVLYLMMVFVTNYRQYHYLFTLLFVYGAYQVIEFSKLQEASAIFYALLGFIFLFLPKLLSDKHELTKVFQYTSIIVSGLAFLFISAKAMTLTMQEPSIMLFIAYLLIAFNFIYAANYIAVNKKVFSYLSTIFIMVGLYELVLVGQEHIGYESIGLPMFLMAFLLYVTFGCYVRLSFFKVIRQASRDIGLLVLVAVMYLHSGLVDLWQVGIMLFLLSIIAILLTHFETRKSVDVEKLMIWLHGLLIGAAVISFYVYWIDQFEITWQGIMPTSAAVAGVIVLGLSGIWRTLKRKDFYHHTFYIAQIFYLFGMVQTLNFISNPLEPITRVLIFLVGIMMVYILYRKTKWTITPYIMGVNVLALYLVTLFAAHQSYDLLQPLFLAFQFTIASALLFMIGFFFKGKHVLFKNAFWIVGHAFLPIALFMELFSTDESALWVIVSTGIIYGISLYKSEKEAYKYVFLYAILLSIVLTVIYTILFIDQMNALKYSLFMTIAIYIVIWYTVSNEWKSRLKFYIVPFSSVSLLLYSFTIQERLPIFILTILLAGFIIWFLIQIKWEIFTIIPIGLLYNAILVFGQSKADVTYGLILAYAVGLFTAGMFYNKQIYDEREKGLSILDWFSIFGFFALFSMHVFSGSNIVEQVLPDVLIVIGLILQRHRVAKSVSKWILSAAALYILKPYYAMLGYFELPELIEVKLYVLPWVAMMSLLKKTVGSRHKTTMKNLQWGVLIVVAAILVIEGMDRGTIYDALIVGTLSLVSMLSGMLLRVKSYFFVGLFVLLLNLLLQTKPFWGNLPWWMYLLIVGALLIIVASTNEWYKQKKSEGKVSFVKKWYAKIVGKMKSWE